jgi:hypothetical protein
MRLITLNFHLAVSSIEELSRLKPLPGRVGVGHLHVIGGRSDSHVHRQHVANKDTFLALIDTRYEVLGNPMSNVQPANTA